MSIIGSTMKILKEQNSCYIHLPIPIIELLDIRKQDRIIVYLDRIEYMDVTKNKHHHYSIRLNIVIIKPIYDRNKPNPRRKTTKLILKKSYIDVMEWKIGDEIELVLSEKDNKAHTATINIIPEKKVPDIPDFLCISDKSLIEKVIKGVKK